MNLENINRLPAYPANIAQITWFIINEISANNLIVGKLIEPDEKANSLFNSIFNDKQNLKTIERLIAFQFTETINQELKKR